MSTNALAVSEVFGPTIQGEGPSAGCPAVFLRLAYCNLRCGYDGGGWVCDTAYTWLFGKPEEVGSLRGGMPVYDPAQEVRRLSVDETVEMVHQHMNHARLLVVTGGEPTLQQEMLWHVVVRCEHYYGLHTEIETNGTTVPENVWLHRRFNVSPKLENSGSWNVKHSSIRLNERALNWHNRNDGSIFKFVVSKPEDLHMVDMFVRRYNLRQEAVWLMPEGTQADEIQDKMSWVFNEAATRGWKVSTRLHVLAFGNKRGV